MIILMFFLIWAIYLSLGILWLYYLTLKTKLTKDYNAMGPIIMVTFWPIHIIYKLIKNEF